MNQPPQALGSSPGLSRTTETMRSIERLFLKHAPHLFDRPGVKSKEWSRFRLSGEAKQKIIHLHVQGLSIDQIYTATAYGSEVVRNFVRRLAKLPRYRAA